ncbi:larval/pupal cuticle protein H1C-like [Chironomus tepperi]|uniref:larval/pupal cuticle protein H1C-like n=1 Tax=Chironomus tepperi TaxID=113505 RepID=UPI00391EE477
MMKVIVLVIMIAVGTYAAGDKKDGVKTKRGVSLDYAYHPISYDHDFIAHAPAVVHHEPVITHAAIAQPVIPAIAQPVIPAAIHAPVIAKASIVSTSVAHVQPARYIAAHPVPVVSSAYVAHPPAFVHTSPLLTQFHKR